MNAKKFDNIPIKFIELFTKMQIVWRNYLWLYKVNEREFNGHFN